MVVTRKHRTVRRRVHFDQAIRFIVEPLEDRRLLSAVTWTGAGDATSWSDANNWSSHAVPGGSDDVTINGPGNPTIKITTGASVGSLTTSTGTLEVVGASFTVNGSANIGGASLYAEGGGVLSINGAATYTGSNGSNTTISASGVGSKIDLSHLTSFNGGGNNGAYYPTYYSTSVLPTNGGEIDLAGAISTNSGSFNVITLDNTGGTINLAASSIIANTTLTAANGARWAVPSDTVLPLGSGDTLTTTGGAQFVVQGVLALRGGVVTVNTDTLSSLDVAVGGAIDIGTSKLLIKYPPGIDPIADIRGYLANGLATGWAGSPSTGSILSSAAASNPKHNTAVSYVDSADKLGVNTTANSIELGYAVYGDTNLDGTTNLADFLMQSRHFGQAGGWDAGDFNYDGSVNLADLLTLTRNFGQSLPPTLSATDVLLPSDPTRAATRRR